MSAAVGEIFLILLLAAGVAGPEPYRSVGSMMMRSSVPAAMWLLTARASESVVSGPVAIPAAPPSVPPP